MSLGDTDGDVLERADVRSADVTPLIAIWDVFVKVKYLWLLFKFFKSIKGLNL